MTMLNMHLTEEEMDIIQARYANDDGFNYFEFLANLDPQQPTEYQYEKRLLNLREVNSKKRTMEVEPVLKDTEAVMDKIKAQVNGLKFLILIAILLDVYNEVFHYQKFLSLFQMIVGQVS